MKTFPQIKKKLLDYSFLCTSLLVLFWLSSLFELIEIYSKERSFFEHLQVLVFKWMNDFITVFIIALFFMPFYIIADKVKNKLGLYLVKVVFVILIFIQLGLVKYSTTTLLNLGADILGYSFDDIFLTVKSSESFSVVNFLPLLLVPLVFILLYRLLKRRVAIKNIVVFGSFVFLISVGFGLLYSQFFKNDYQNKLSFLTVDIVKYQIRKSQVQTNLDGRSDYPYLKSTQNIKDVLSPYFSLKKEKPNVVIVVLEGLGGEFVGDNSYAGFTPYLDALSKESLYWPNFLSTTGRSFGVLPALLGSLPYGEKGFLELPELPSHLSLISVLKANGYTTSFYAGHQSSFDKKIGFLNYNGIDYVVDENNFGEEFEKSKANSGGYSWGYPDAEIYKKTLSVLNERKQPRLDILVTLSNHEPFEFPEKKAYLVKVDSMLNSGQNINADRANIAANKEIYASLLYTDQSLAKFMQGYAKRPEYNNTIFIITGDHRLIPIAQKDQLCRYHVPMYIYSPMLKRAKTFKSVSSHLNVAPSLLSFLMNNYRFNPLEKTAWVGKEIDTVAAFRNVHEIPLMKYKGMINDFVYKEYLYADEKLYKIKENFGTYKIENDSLSAIIDAKLKAYKKQNAYVTKRDKIFPDSLNIYVVRNHKFTQEEKQKIETITKGYNFDEVFNIAREKAFSKDFETAILLCTYILNNLPNHVDARVLKGRVLAWNSKYKEAEGEFVKALERSPFYDDVYSALLDLYWWSGQDIKSKSLGVRAKKNKISNAEVGFKLAKAYARINEKTLALQTIDSILKIHPNNTAYINFKESLK